MQSFVLRHGPFTSDGPSVPHFIWKQRSPAAHSSCVKQLCPWPATALALSAGAKCARRAFGMCSEAEPDREIACSGLLQSVPARFTDRRRCLARAVGRRGRADAREPVETFVIATARAAFRDEPAEDGLARREIVEGRIDTGAEIAADGVRGLHDHRFIGRITLRGGGRIVGEPTLVDAVVQADRTLGVELPIERGEELVALLLLVVGIAAASYATMNLLTVCEQYSPPAPGAIGRGFDPVPPSFVAVVRESAVFAGAMGSASSPDGFCTKQTVRETRPFDACTMHDRPRHHRRHDTNVGALMYVSAAARSCRPSRSSPSDCRGNRCRRSDVPSRAARLRRRAPPNTNRRCASP